MEKRAIQVYCQNEGVVVGHMELVPGIAKLTAMTFINSFVPVSGDYRLAYKMPDRMQHAKCPKCGGALGIISNRKKESETLQRARQAARERARASAQQMSTGPNGQNLNSSVGKVIESRSAQDGIDIIFFNRMKIKIE